MKALADDAFDLLCTDAVMPGQSVESVIEHFRELHPHSPIFVVSGYLPEGVLAKMQADERIRILFKPLTTQRLISAFESALGSSPS